MSTAQEYQDKIVKKASEDNNFRAQLMSDPTAAIGAELKVEMPKELIVKVHEDSQNTVNLVLPPRLQLNEEELEGVAGGIPVNYPDPYAGWD